MRALLLLPFATGCIFVLDDDGKACDAMATSSVAVTVDTEDGRDASAAVVRFSANGGDFQACDSFSRGEWTCGWEVAGDITVRVELEGYQTFEDTVFIEQGECHVVPKHVDALLALEDVDCTDVEMTSVVATVVGSSGEALSDVLVTWNQVASDDVAEPCDPAGGDTWNCGYEVAGDLVITASASGHVPESQEVTVRADECHVLTEAVYFTLEWGAD